MKLLGKDDLFLKESVCLKIDTLSSDGSGIARREGDGFVFFVPGALPGEEVEARVILKKKHYAVTELQNILKPHSQRTSPRCPWYGECGGCQLQHCSYSMQLELKTQIVKEAFSRIAHISVEDVISSCIPSPKEWGYRNKASFPVRKNSSGKNEVGFFKRRSHSLIPIDACPILEPALNQMYGRFVHSLQKLNIDGYNEKKHSGILRHIIFRCGSFSRELLACYVVRKHLSDSEIKRISQLWQNFVVPDATFVGVIENENAKVGNTILGQNSRILYGQGELKEILNSREIHYDGTAFFQVNSYQAAQLFAFCSDCLEKEEENEALELYSGVGAMSLFLAPKFKRLTTIEEWPSAVEATKKNAALNKFSNIIAYEGKAEDIVSNLKQNFNTVILDPPRSGCDPKVIQQILEWKPEKVLYVACNPATLARDVALLHSGGYKLEKLQPFDMFPQTVHVETVVLMSRVDK